MEAHSLARYKKRVQAKNMLIISFKKGRKEKATITDFLDFGTV